MFTPSEEVHQQIWDHATRAVPVEACGVVLVFKGRQRYMECRNLAAGNEHFVIDPLDLVHAENLGEVIAYVHSHPTSSPDPSEADLRGIEVSGLPWLIVNPATGRYTVTLPSDHVSPLYGRQFAHGIFDCYSFAQDFYKQQCGLILPDFRREDFWWEKGYDLLTSHLKDSGFIEVPRADIRVLDGIIFKIRCNVANHVGVLVGDNTVAHHQAARLSSKDSYGNLLRESTFKVVRHESML